MTLDLLKRSEKGAALTAAEHDTNFTNIETEVNGKAAASHTHALADITDAGTAAAAATGDFATAAQGATADSALQPSDITTGLITADTADVDFVAINAAVGLANSALQPGEGVPADSVTTISGTTYTLTEDDKARNGVLLVVDNTNQNCAITMPDASAIGAWRIRSETTGTITISRETSGTIDGGTSVTMTGLGREGKLEVIKTPGGVAQATFEGESDTATVQDADHDANGFDISNAVLVDSTVSGSINLSAATLVKTHRIAGTGFTLAAADNGGVTYCTAAITITWPSSLDDDFMHTVVAAVGNVVIDGGTTTTTITDETAATLIGANATRSVFKSQARAAVT